MCYRCGTIGHRSVACKYKDKGLKCFKCNEFEHKAIECKSSNKDYTPVKKVEPTINKMCTKNLTLNTLQKASVFSTTNLKKNGFFHVDVNEVSRKYTSFVTSYDKYWFLKVFF